MSEEHHLDLSLDKCARSLFWSKHQACNTCRTSSSVGAPLFQQVGCNALGFGTALIPLGPWEFLRIRRNRMHRIPPWSFSTWFVLTYSGEYMDGTTIWIPLWCFPVAQTQNHNQRSHHLQLSLWAGWKSQFRLLRFDGSCACNKLQMLRQKEWTTVEEPF